MLYCPHDADFAVSLDYPTGSLPTVDVRSVRNGFVSIDREAAFPPESGLTPVPCPIVFFP